MNYHKSIIYDEVIEQERHKSLTSDVVIERHKSSICENVIECHKYITCCRMRCRHGGVLVEEMCISRGLCRSDFVTRDP